MNNEDTDETTSPSLVSGCGSCLVGGLMILYPLITFYSSIIAIQMFFLGITAGFQGTDTLICNRIELSKIDCQLIRSSFLGKQSETIPDLQKAEIRISQVREQSKIKTYSYNYRIFLITKSGPYTVFYPKNSSKPQDTTLFKSEVSYINDFINNPGKKNIKMEEKEYALALAYIKSGINFLIIGWLPWIIMLSIFCSFRYFSNRADRQEAPR